MLQELTATNFIAIFNIYKISTQPPKLASDRDILETFTSKIFQK